jgi:hypothetical protein
MGGSCSTHGEMRSANKYYSENLKGNLSVDEKIT